MIKTKRLTTEGLLVFRKWLEAGESGTPPTDLIDGSQYTEPAYETEVEPDAVFSSRYEFGAYLHDRFRELDYKELISRENDGLWAWLAVVYFKQLAPIRPQKYWHYIVTHRGTTASLAYRHAVRTSYELTYIHGERALLCLGVPMHAWGEMAEQLASRQTLALNRGFFEAAYALYVKEGKLMKGASSKPKKAQDRKPGDRSGLGSARRLAVALHRMDLTFDTEIMKSSDLIIRLPKEFSRWRKAA